MKIVNNEEELEGKKSNIGMPLLKGRSKTIKVEPSIHNKTRNTLPEKGVNQEETQSDEKGIMPPYLSTLKYQLKDSVDAEAIRQSDYLEEGIEYTSLPAHRTKGAQSITLPLNMPVVEREKLCFRRKSDNSPNFKHKVHSSSTGDSKVSLLGSHIDAEQNIASEREDNLSDTCPTSGKWFNDIDKLTSFKAKHRLEIFSKEKKEMVKEWTSTPKKFYKCILKCRQKELACNGYRVTKREQGSTVKRVSFPADVLLFSAIEENASKELIEIIRTHRVDLNLCKNARGLPPLHRAVQRGAVDCVRVLLYHAADVNLRDSTNRPAINLAISMRQFECIVLLIESGASVEEYTQQCVQEYEDALVLSKSCYRSFEVNV